MHAMRFAHIFTPRINALIAAIVYGCWAFYTNSEHGLVASSKAGIIQAIYAFMSTLSVSNVALRIFHFFDNKTCGLIYGFIGSFILMITIPSGVHYVSGTPDIIETILPGVVFGSTYLGAFLWNLHKVNYKK